MWLGFITPLSLTLTAVPSECRTTGTSTEQQLFTWTLGIDSAAFLYCTLRARAFAGYGALYNAVYTVVKRRRFFAMYTKVEFHVDGE
jgi:hypothetical protein